MTNRRITLELELSGEVMEAYEHLEGSHVVDELVRVAHGVTVCVVGDSNPPEMPRMYLKQAD